MFSQPDAEIIQGSGCKGTPCTKRLLRQFVSQGITFFKIASIHGALCVLPKLKDNEYFKLSNFRLEGNLLSNENSKLQRAPIFLVQSYVKPFATRRNIRSIINTLVTKIEIDFLKNPWKQGKYRKAYQQLQQITNVVTGWVLIHQYLTSNIQYSCLINDQCQNAKGLFANPFDLKKRNVTLTAAKIQTFYGKDNNKKDRAT